MKRVLLAVVAVCVGVCGCASVGEPAGEGQRLLAEAVAVLREAPLGRERVDWDAVERELMATVPARGGAADAHGAIVTAVQRLGDPHAKFIPAVPAAADGGGSPATTAAGTGLKELAEAGEREGFVPRTPWGKMLEGRVAYVQVPMCAAAEVAGLRAFAGGLRDVVMRLEAERPAAWVVDLRMNGGGNVWPMVVGLRPLIGDGRVATSVREGAVVAEVECVGERAWLTRAGERVEQFAIEERGDSVAAAPVAVLVGAWTMSSGEFVALAFRGRARLFGEPTGGYVTATEYFRLADGSVLNLPTSVMADRLGVAAQGRVQPDEVVEGGVWPLSGDAVARAAAAWGRARASGG